MISLFPARIALLCAAFALATTTLAACTTSDPGGPSAVIPTGSERDTEIKHEACDVNAPTATRLDVNGDNRPDIVHVMNGPREVCRVVDLNLDGSFDAFIYYDESGQERRRESDFDRDGRPDEIVSLRGGVVFLKERETNFDDQIDTWDYYENGRLVRRERDSDSDGLIDQWWAFNDPTNPSCAAVATDRNVDGKPDPDSVVDACAEARAKAAQFNMPAPPPPPNPAPNPSAKPQTNPPGLTVGSSGPTTAPQPPTPGPASPR